MSSLNDITGDALVSKQSTEAYRDGWDRIFSKQPGRVIDEADEPIQEFPKKDAKQNIVLNACSICYGSGIDVTGRACHFHHIGGSNGT